MVNIIKASGEIAPFAQEKLRKSLQRIGAYPELIEEILNEVIGSLHEGMATHEIYRIAFRLLRQKSQALAAKYHLKRAIMRPGITGYPFEKYFAEILRHKGYQAKNNQIIKGYCVNHEVDVVAKKDKQTIFVECKYHNVQGKKCNVKIPLYVKARFIDIVQKQKETATTDYEMWLATNTRFTTDALQYGRCAGLHLIGWDYPHGISQLFANDIVLCKSIHDSPSILDKLRISTNRKASIINQCQILCHRS